MIRACDVIRVGLCAFGVGCIGPDHTTPAADASISKVTCVPAVEGELQDVRDVPYAPYLVHHPAIADPNVQTIMFLPGGSGSRGSAQFAWDTFLAGDPRVANYRVLIPYSDSSDLIDQGPRAFNTLDAVLSCYGGDPARVHVAGFSNGGRMAFWFMLVRPDRFVTLVGAPGLFPPSTPAGQTAALGNRPVLNGVGELDDEWRPSVKATHDALVDAGANSIYVEFPGGRHRPSAAFDETVLFAFWASH
ncbi:MAG: hypothetical protein HYY84_20665 [Deltaproteobacteria bacterium]|nr:hypothetical protein [Deltaproteobacteria bacterium]